MPRKGQKHSEQVRRRISSGTRYGLSKRAALARIAPGELLELQRNGTLSKSLRPFAADAIGEAVAIVADLGGEDRLSAQQMALVQDATRLGLLLRALVAYIAQGDALDLESVGKVTTLIGARRASLTALGLERHAEDVPDLRAYLEQRSDTPQDGAQRTDGTGPDVHPQEDEERPQGADGGSDGG